jgi:cytochrome c peroxidase
MSEPMPSRSTIVWPRGIVVAGACLLAAFAMLVFAKRGMAPVSSPGLAVGTLPVKEPSKGGAGPADRARIELGRKIFSDLGMSEPAGTSCASCHDPSRAYAGNNGSTNGVARGSRPGHFAKRNTPSALYLRAVKRFHFHWEEDMPLPDAFAGFFWDGRASSIAELTRQPLLNPDEMNNHDAAQIAAKVKVSPYADDFARAFGPSFDDADAVLANVGKAIEAFLSSDEMSPYTSKYDDVLRGRAHFTELETRGLALFKDREKGNCRSCHKFDDGVSDPSRSLFTDYGFEVVGIPRNRELPATADSEYADLGLCKSPTAPAPAKEERFCGAFRTPSLRNVAVRSRFMHNGAFASLRDVVKFYATRDADPKRWYPQAKFDDLPAQYRRYVNTNKVPYSTSAGDKPRLDDGDVDAILAFLGTLTDAAYR